MKTSSLPPHSLRLLVLLAFCLGLLLPTLSHAGLRLGAGNRPDASVCSTSKKPLDSGAGGLNKACEHCATLSAPGLPLDSPETWSCFTTGESPVAQPALAERGNHEEQTLARGPPR